jgi:hypothetical protein
MRLSDDEFRDILARAEEIQRTSRRGAEIDAELSAVIGAAEAVGLTRSAVERALRERLNLPATPPAPGDLVFATSADGNAYVAEVRSIDPDEVVVRFLRGSEHRVALDQLRPLSLIPGERVVCHWPWWGPWTCTVVGYDAAAQRVELSDGWGETRTFPLAEVWLGAPRQKGATSAARHRALKLLGTGAVLGALLGSMMTVLLGG